YIAAVNEAHCELTVRFLRAGKAVMCEKPMGISLDEARKMLMAERETGSFLQIGFELRYSELYKRVKNWIEAGLIGQPLNSHCQYYCSEFHKKGSWRSESRGTLIGEKLSHYLDLPRWWIGDEVTEVFSMHAPNFITYFNHPDNHQISCKFANGAVSTLNFIMGIAETDGGDPLQDVLVKQADDGHALKYIIYGTKGAIETDIFRRRIRRWEFTDGPKQLESKLVETITFTKNEDSEWFHNTYGQNQAIARLVAEGKKPENPASDSYETMKLCFAAEISEKEGRIVNLSELESKNSARTIE
ncbi:MAG: Gfo/Idh/MocA family oxidoreductase, partial [Planctomycetes bacterium]|nr:Gfo/Idh/MocA family oxidoreductase [Planctomycetota bacterium]